MTKTGAQIEADILSVLDGTDLAATVSGGLYHYGQRPRDSRLEDITVQWLTGTAGIPQEGTVNVLIFVPDTPRASGIMAEDRGRTAELEEMGRLWLAEHSGALNYHLRLAEAIHSEDDPDIDQHVVYIKLRYRYL